MPKKPAAAETSPVADFENALTQLETLVERMEGGELSLEESLGAYERGVSLYRRCQQALEDAELRVKLLSDPASPERAQPFGDAAADDSDA
ncbi:exodeoxyribonuclease VII small subunit [Luteimonas sp. XNQY3]|nr:exodeoxyribonuclease VII small subunit [Luteimonas sp. XNQY3]MCD9005396.1 exodeoxyribonuclease VII small subunit [Luteimonas sp. XNQY3]